MNAIVSHQPQQAATTSSMVPTDMTSAIRLAEMMSRARLVPQHLQGQPGDCLMVVELSMRLGMSPFAVAQCTSVISGKLMMEGKLVSAAVQASGVLSGRLDYEFKGEGAQRAVTIGGTLRGETTPRTLTVALSDVKTTNSLWTKQPDQQLVYASTRIWARRFVPEVMLGVYTPEEFDSQPQQNFGGTTIDSQAEPVHQIAPPEPKKQTISEWLDALQSDLSEAASSEGVDAIITRPDVQSAMDKLRNGAKDRLNQMVNAAIQRTAPPTDDGFPGTVNEPDPIERTIASYGDARALGA